VSHFPATSSGSAWPNTVNTSHLLSEAFMTSSQGQALSLTSPMLLCHTAVQSAVFTTKGTHIVHLLLSSNGFWQNPDSTTFAWFCLLISNNVISYPVIPVYF